MTIIKKCKDCKHFMADCNFSKVDKELQAMEDFIACKHFKSKNETNADKIRNMSDEELMEFIVGLNNHYLAGIGKCDCSNEGAAYCEDICKRKTMEWLQAEADRRKK